jgi:hypothetical protein
LSGGGADSIEDSVSRSWTMDCMRCDCSAIICKVALLFVAVDVDFLQGFEEAGQHGQRRAQFVRHVGDEVAAHAVEAVGLRDILDLHQASIAA